MITYDKLHIIVFVGRNSCLTFFAMQFVKYLAALQIDHYVADADRPETFTSEEFYNFSVQQNVAVFSFNNIGIGMSAGGNENFWRKHNIPFFVYLVDHPRNYSDSLRNPACDIYAFALDRNHVSFMKDHYSGLKGIFYSPNGGVDVGVAVPYNERLIDVIYMGGCQSAVEYFPSMDFLGSMNEVYYKYTISALNENQRLSSDDAIKHFLESYNLDLSEEQIFRLFAETAIYIEAVIRRRTKLEGIKALDEAGVHVDIYGDCWINPDYPFSDNIRVHKRVEPDEILKLVGNAKISLCYMPMYKKGSSEKVFDSMLNGALCVSDHSEYLDINYVDGDNIVYFDLNNPEQMAADVKWLLEHSDVAAQIAECGHETANKYDTWDIRFGYVLGEILQVINAEVESVLM